MAKKRYVPGIGKRAFTKAERASYRAGFKAGRAFERRIWKSMM